MAHILNIRRNRCNPVRWMTQLGYELFRSRKKSGIGGPPFADTVASLGGWDYDTLLQTLGIVAPGSPSLAWALSRRDARYGKKSNRGAAEQNPSDDVERGRRIRGNTFHPDWDVRSDIAAQVAH